LRRGRGQENTGKKNSYKTIKIIGPIHEREPYKEKTRTSGMAGSKEHEGPCRGTARRDVGSRGHPKAREGLNHEQGK